MWQRTHMRNNTGSVTKNDVARPGRTAPLVLVVFDESPLGTDGSQFESLPGTSGNIIPGREASTGPHRGGPNSVGPQADGGRLWTPLAAPSFARGHPWTPRACLFLPLGPRLRRPSVQPPSRPRASPLDLSEVRGPGRVPGSAARPSLFLQPKGCLPLETRNRTIDINHKNR